MNNETMNPLYKGSFLPAICEGYELEYVHIDAGTVLVQDIQVNRCYFQLNTDYTYRRRPPRRLFTNPLMEILLGSAIYETGTHAPSNIIYVAPDFVRMPTDEELIWYETIATI